MPSLPDSGAPAPAQLRRTYVGLALGTIALGLVVHLRGAAALGATARDVLGDALWAMMIYWWVGVIAPSMSLARRSVVALLICVAVEFGQLVRTPWLTAVRATRLGHLMLGSDFDARDLLAYATGVALAALQDIRLFRSVAIRRVIALLSCSLAWPMHESAAQRPNVALTAIDARAQLTNKFRERLQEIARATDGVVGIGVIDLKSGERFGVNDTLAFPQGSAIKIPLLIELFRQAETGALSLDERLTVRAVDQVGGTGVAQWFGDAKSELSLRDLAVLMIVLSDNTATNLLIDKVGMASVNSTMSSLGVSAIRLQRRMITPRESAVGNENLATPAQAADLMRRVHACELPMSKARCEDVRRILEIPKNGEFPSSVPSTVRVAWKPGSVEGVETSWGLFALPGNPYVVTVMVTYSDGAPAARAIRQVADATYEYMRRVARASAFGVRVPITLADSIRKR